MSEKKSSAKTLFDTLYEGCKEAIKIMRKPLARKSLKRKINSGWDDAQAKIDTANVAIEDEVMKVTNCDLKVILTHKQTIRSLEEQQEDLANLWKTMFNEEFDSSIE